MELPLVKPDFVGKAKELYPIYVDGAYSDENEHKRSAYCLAAKNVWSEFVLGLEEEVNAFREYVSVDVEMYQLRLWERDQAELKADSLEKSNKFLNEQINEISKINNSHVALLEKKDSLIESLQEEKKVLGERVLTWVKLTEEKGNEAQGWYESWKRKDAEHEELKKEIAATLKQYKEWKGNI